jgi:DNA-binding Xre family transcriptional regulator
MKLKRAVAKRISDLMLQKNIHTQYALCKKACITESTLRNIINERNESLNLVTLMRICDGLETTVQEFLNDDLFDREKLEID